MELITINNVTKRFKNGTVALNDISLEIGKGEFVFVIGPTGCGKSTLIKVIYREEKPTSGEVFVGGVNVAKLRNRKVYKIRRKMGVVFQDFKLLEKLTVYENVAFALEIFGLKSDEIHKKVAIDRAIVNGPKLLICDEPTGNLDEETSMEIMEVLKNVNEIGTTIIMVTHDTHIVEKMKKRVIELESGQIKKDYAKGKYKRENI